MKFDPPPVSGSLPQATEKCSGIIIVADQKAAGSIYRRYLNFNKDEIRLSAASCCLDLLVVNLIFHPGDVTNYCNILQD